MKESAVKLFLLLMLTLISCSSNVEILYNPNTTLSNDSSLKKLDAPTADKTIVVFTSGFVGDTIEIKNGNQILFKDQVKTIPQLSLAGLEVVSNC